ncbi:MAG: T9SS type A sorting domain-containing protein [Ignavibacteriales bacterium]|nr:T9SS type A sorting domain-containing protein [Ignavibacteriales bacterium]
MKNLFYSSFFIVLLIPIIIIAQSVTGKLVDENGEGLAEVQLQLYAAQNVYNAVSLSDGSFTFDNVSNVEDNQLPTGYAVSNNFPNPFNPTTRIGITIPGRDNVKIEVFNLLGQAVADVIERSFSAGTNFIDLELNGLPNGLYFARITIDEKYSVTKKMMLIYGSQHLITGGSTISTQLNKPDNTKGMASHTYLDTNLDSLVATSLIFGRKTFMDLPNISGDTLELGNLIIDRFCPGTPTVTYEGKTYYTVQIGDQCWLRKNLDVGTTIGGSQNATDNGVIEKYCYDNDPANCFTYGGLYQWDEAMQYVTTEGTKGICPPRWHFPTVADFQKLMTEVGGYFNGNALKEIGQGTGDGAGTNTSGFSALLAGYRFSLGFFDNLGYITGLWSSTEFNATKAYGLYLYYDISSASLAYDSKVHGSSVRCVKD